MAKTVSRHQKILSQEDVEKIIDGAKDNVQETSMSNQFDVMLIKTCLGHGLRNGETVTLQRKHVDLDQVGVTIESENTKTDSGVRKVPTLDTIGEIQIKEEFISWVEQNTDNREDYLFSSPRTSSHITERYFQKLLADLAWDLGFYPHLNSKDMVENEVDEEKRVRPHALRHTYGTRLYENGVPSKELQSLMGHSKVETTENLYTHLSNERSRDMLDEAAKKWD